LIYLHLFFKVTLRCRSKPSCRLHPRCRTSLVRDHILAALRVSCTHHETVALQKTKEKVHQDIPRYCDEGRASCTPLTKDPAGRCNVRHIPRPGDDSTSSPCSLHHYPKIQNCRSTRNSHGCWCSDCPLRYNCAHPRGIRRCPLHIMTLQIPSRICT
jgi:hypothetical protein